MGKGKTQPLLSVCVKNTPHLGAAVLLYRICFWHGKGQAKANGRTWIAKRREEWQHETGLTTDQTKKAFKALVDMSHIEVEQHFFGGRKMPFVRLLPRGLTVIAECRKAPQLVPESTTASAGKHHTQQGGTQGDTQGGTSGNPFGIAGEELAIIDDIPVAEPDHPDYAHPSKEADMANIADTLKNTKKKPVKKGQTTTPFHSVWSKAVAEVTGEYQVPLTQKKKGQLRHFEKACPKGKAELVALTIIENWHLFTKTVKAATGQFTLPSKPSIDFALKHVQHAVAYWISQENPDDAVWVEPPEEDEVKLIAEPEPAPAPDPADTKASPAELNDILFGEDDDD